MPFEIMSLVRETYRQTRLKRIYPPPGVTRLVKILYLAEIEWRRTHHGQPMTELTWKFYYFGPYADELREVLGGSEMEVSELVGGKTIRRFIFDEAELDSPQAPEEVASVLGRIVKEWGDANINTLLNHVYFNTEPMETAQRGDLLDFSSLIPAKALMLELDPGRLGALREKLDKRVKELRLTREGVHSPIVNMDERGAWHRDEKNTQLPPGTKVTFE